MSAIYMQEQKAVAATENSGWLPSWVRMPHLVPDDSRHRLEFLFEEDADGAPAANHWSLGSRLCYGAGYTYLAALAAGGAWGVTEGLRNPLGSKGLKLRWACLLNGVTARGPLVGNTAASAAVVYNLLHGLVLKAVGGKYEGLASSGTCAAATGALFNASLGAKAAIKGSLALSSFVLAYRALQDNLL